MEKLSYNERLALIRFQVSMLAEVKEATLIANDKVFYLLLDTLSKLDGRIELRRGFEYFRETPEDESFNGFVEAELDRYFQEFWQICNDFDKDSSPLQECSDAFATVLASMYVISKDYDAFITKIARHFCLWAEMYDYKMLVKVLAAFDYQTFREMLDKWSAALDEYCNNTLSVKERAKFMRLQYLLTVITEMFDSLTNKNQE